METTPIGLTQTFGSLPSLNDGMLLAFYLVAAIYVTFSGIFYYHWQQYSTNKKITWITYVVFLSTTIPLMIIMALLTMSV